MSPLLSRSSTELSSQIELGHIKISTKHDYASHRWHEHLHEAYGAHRGFANDDRPSDPRDPRDPRELCDLNGLSGPNDLNDGYNARRNDLKRENNVSSLSLVSFTRSFRVQTRSCIPSKWSS